MPAQGCFGTSMFTPTWLGLKDQAPPPPAKSRLWLGFAWTLGLSVAMWSGLAALLFWLI